MKNPMKPVLATLLAATSALALWACQTVVCGTGTVEIDGVCSAEGEPQEVMCGAGSIYDPATGQCQANFCDGGDCGLCDPTTSVLEYNDAGVPVCRGTGVGPGCENEISDCPQGSNSKMQICGRLYDLETSKQIHAAGFEVTFYDALKFANSTANAEYYTVVTDSCGRFSATSGGESGVTVPNTAFIAVGVDDGAGAPDTIRTSGLVVSGASNGKIQGVRVFALSKATDIAWSAVAFPPTGTPTFADRGVYVPIYINTTLDPPVVEDPLEAVFLGLPTSGVVITKDGSSTPANDYYFSDSTPLTRTTLDLAQNATGVNGSGLYVGGTLVEYSGMGGEPSGSCTWPSNLASTIPNVVFVQERDSVLVDGEPCP